MRFGSAGDPFRWYISQPAKCGPLTPHFSRLPSDVSMNAPFLVPTSTRTPLMRSLLLKKSMVLLSMSWRSTALQLARRFPQPHHSPIGVCEESVGSHARYFLLLDEYLSARRSDLLAIGRQVVDVDI